MWLRDILQPRQAAPEPAPATPVSAPVSSQVAPVPPPAREFRLSPIADDDATQRSAGVPDLPGEPSAVDDDENPTIGRPRESGPIEAADLPEPGAIVGGTYRVVAEL